MGGQSLTPRLVVCGWAAAEVTSGAVPARHSRQELVQDPAREQVPLPLSKGLDEARVTCSEQGGDMEGQSSPFTLFPGRKVMPQDVSAACGNAMPPKRNYCLKSTQEDLFPRISYLGNLHHSSKAECLFGNKKMRCGPKSTIACSTVAESLRRHQRQLLARSTKGRAGWAGGPAGVCCLWCVLQYWLQSCKVSGIFLLQHKGNS